MTEKTLTIIVDGKEYQIPNTVETEAEILQAIEFNPSKYALYRDVDKKTLSEEDRVGVPAVVSDGDAFVVFPKSTIDG